MRVEHEGEYALVASKGGAPDNPLWYYNLAAFPEDVVLQDGPEPFAVTVRQIEGEEYAKWWERAVKAYPPYADYQERTSRTDSCFSRAPRRGLSGSQLSSRTKIQKGCPSRSA